LALPAAGAWLNDLVALTSLQMATLDAFDCAQLDNTVGVWRAARTSTETRGVLFAASGSVQYSVSDADRLRENLARFGLSLRAQRSRELALTSTPISTAAFRSG
jgi:sigma54-dependent transcription regulator